MFIDFVLREAARALSFMLYRVRQLTRCPTILGRQVYDRGPIEGIKPIPNRPRDTMADLVCASLHEARLALCAGEMIKLPFVQDVAQL